MIVTFWFFLDFRCFPIPSVTSIVSILSFIGLLRTTSMYHVSKFLSQKVEEGGLFVEAVVFFRRNGSD